jgi:hypothetical protein
MQDCLPVVPKMHDVLLACCYTDAVAAALMLWACICQCVPAKGAVAVGCGVVVQPGGLAPHKEHLIAC